MIVKMLDHRILLVLGVIFTPSTYALWSCTQNSDCYSLSGSICSDGDCRCPVGQQPAFGGTVCVDLAPYHTSVCVDDHQCSRLFTTFGCLRETEDAETGLCLCQPGNHYFLGRCWHTIDYGAPCSRNEECLGTLRDPFNLVCNGTCRCAEGFYERQRGECRKIAHAVGDGCVLNEDCQFDNGACNVEILRCYNTNNPPQLSPAEQEHQAIDPVQQNTIENNNALRIIMSENNMAENNIVENKTAEINIATRTHGVHCDFTNPCAAPFVCSMFGVCICPVGYYNTGGTGCLAELGSPSDEEQCVGLFVEVRNGICTCLANFYFDVNMRDCIRVTRRINESCVTDSHCHTFGTAARCGPPQAPWGIRSCECDLEQSVWVADREMCRLFAGIGEYCQVDSDCLAGEVEIQCVLDDEGRGTCECPDGYIAQDGLCLTTGLGLGEVCQASVECTDIPNLACEDGVCACDSRGYEEVDGHCAPIIGGVCADNSDCVINNTICYSDTESYIQTCQCDALFVEYDEVCWPVVSEIDASCEVDAQCIEALGEASECQEGICICVSDYHLRDGYCWPMTGLFEGCSRTSQCYLPSISDRVVCRNSLCQCDFHYPFSEELNTCLTSTATNLVGSLLVISCALFYIIVS